MEERHGQAISMSSVAKAAGISRQAVYLHFASRTELIIATSKYVDELKGLDERLKQFYSATTGIQMLEACVEVWGNYIPEIYGLAKAMLLTRDTDAAMAAAWNSNMACLRDVCRETIEALDREGKLYPQWPHKEAIEMFMTIISINNWEQLTMECGWSKADYINWIERVLKRTFIN